jgi:hypothetical protein
MFVKMNVMKTEMKIALALIAVNTILGHLLSAPEFIGGLLLGLSLFFMVMGMLSENAYLKFKQRQAQKWDYLKKVLLQKMFRGPEDTI